jgi:hypothetical protein
VCMILKGMWSSRKARSGSSNYSGYRSNLILANLQEITLDAFTGRILNGHVPTIVEGLQRTKSVIHS